MQDRNAHAIEILCEHYMPTPQRGIKCLLTSAGETLSNFAGPK